MIFNYRESGFPINFQVLDWRNLKNVLSYIYVALQNSRLFTQGIIIAESVILTASMKTQRFTNILEAVLAHPPPSNYAPGQGLVPCLSCRNKFSTLVLKIYAKSDIKGFQICLTLPDFLIFFKILSMGL